MQFIHKNKSMLFENAIKKRTSFNFVQMKYYPWLVILLCALFLFYKYILQISPSVMTASLMQAFHVNGAGLGNLAATYFYVYLIAQLFAGPLLDQYSPRLITTLAISVCALGILMFAHANTLFQAQLSRSLIGLGGAFATVSYMKMTSIWFKHNQMSFADGLLSTAAMLGALSGQMPLAFLMQDFGWKNSLVYCGLAGMILAVIFLFIVRDRNQYTPYAPAEKRKTPFKLKEFIYLLRKPENWLLTFYSGLVFTPISVLGGLWGNPFFMETYHLKPTHAAFFSSLMFLGLAVGGPFFGYFADRVGRLKIMTIGTLISLFSLILIIFILNLPLFLLALLLFIFGWGTGAFMSCFALGKEFNDIKFTATIISLVNTGDALFGSFTEPSIGKILDLNWSGQIVNGIHHFSAKNFQYAFSILPIYTVAALICLFILKKYRSWNVK